MMSAFRYPQFCLLARAVEVLGHRWTLLIVRNLLVGGPQRFKDLRAGLAGISTSVLAQRLAELEARGVIRRRTLPPPAGSTVYELDEAGRALAPVVTELSRWGRRYMTPPQPGDQVVAAWVRDALVTFKRWEPTPPIALEIHLADGSDEVVVEVRGGPDGTSVTNVPGRGHDAVLHAGPAELLGALLGHVSVEEALADGRLRVRGDASAVARLPELFDLHEGAPTLPDGASGAAAAPR